MSNGFEFVNVIKLIAKLNAKFILLLITHILSLYIQELFFARLIVGDSVWVFPQWPLFPPFEFTNICLISYYCTKRPLRPVYPVTLVFSYVVKGIKIKVTVKFRASRRLRFEDTKKVMSPEMARNVSGLSRNRPQRGAAKSMFFCCPFYES